MKVIKRTMTPAELARLENSVAQAEVMAAKIDYIAMMADVDIPTEDEEGGAEYEPEV